MGWIDKLSIMEKKIFVLIFLVVLLLYFPVFGTYFTGDDFFHFKATLSDESLLARDYAFFRPVFREFLYRAFYNFFGLSQLPFRILQFVIHFGNIFFVYLLIKKLFKNRSIGLLAAFFFGVNAANIGSLYYLAGGVQAQGSTFFMLLSLYLFWNGKRLLSFFSFILALSSHELAIVTPVLLAGLVLVEETNIKKAVKNIVFNLWPCAILVVIFIYLNIFIIGLPQGEIQYSLSLNPKMILNTIGWYSVWALGLPEMLVDFVQSGFSLNPNLIKFWGSYFKIIFPAFFASLGVLGGATIYLLVKKREIVLDKRLLFLVFWFVVGLLPVLFLPIHKKTYYLQPVLPAFWGLVGYLIFNLSKKYKILAFIATFSLFILSIASIKLSEKTYWAIQRGKISQKLIGDIKAKYPVLPRGAVVYIKNDPNYPFIAKEWGGTSAQAFLALSGSNAFQLVYNDPALVVYYEDRQSPQKNEVFEFVAEIPH